MKKYNRKSIFFTLLISFIIILLFPILAQTWLYLKMENIIKDHANRSNIAMLKQVSDALDSELNTLNQLTAQISFNPKLLNLLSQQSGTKKNIYQYYSFMKDMQNYHILNNFIYDYYIYFPREEVIVSPKIKTTSDFFYNNYYYYQNLNYDGWKNEFRAMTGSSKFLPSMVLEGISTSPKRVITYLHALPHGEYSYPKGYLVVLLNEQKINEILQNLEWNKDANLFIVDENQQLLLSVGNDQQLFNQFRFTFKETSGAFEFKYNNRDYLTTYTISKNSKWNYIYVVPKDIIMKRVKQVKLWALALLLFCLVGGLIASYYLAYRHYIPVKELVQSITRHMNYPRQNKNEYEMIKESLIMSWANEKQLHIKLREYTPQVRTNFLTRLLKGFVDKSSLNKETLDFLNISLQSDEFVVVVIDIEEGVPFDQGEEEKHWALTRFILMNISEELLNEKFNVMIIEMDQKRIATIVNFLPSTKGLRELNDILQQIKKVMETRFQIFISIGIGLEYKGLENVDASYREAVQALNYRMIKGNQQIIYFQDTKEAKSDYYYPEGIEAQLMNFIKLGEYEQAEILLDEIYKENFQSRIISFEIGKILFFNIMNTHLKIIHDIQGQYECIFPNNENPTEKLLQCETAEEMHFKIKEIYKRICDYVRENRTSHSERLLQQIQDYIHKNYANNMLSLSLIAEEMNVTPQYLSTFYKKLTGENLSDAIAKIRLEHAKELLKQEDLTISQIAKKIGYSNDVGLIRLFKKYEGITPGSYRRNIKNAT